MNNIAILELLNEMDIAANLASKEHLSAKEQREFVTATQRVSVLKMGVTNQQIAEARTEMWRKKAGLRGEYRPGLTAEESRKLVPLFTEYLCSHPDRMGLSDYEQRATVLLGRPVAPQTYSGTAGALVPLEFSENFWLGLAQYSPLLDPDVVTLEKSEDYTLRSSVAAEWDLSTFSAQRVGAPSDDGTATLFDGQTIPYASANLLNGYIYKAALNTSLELLQDDPTLLSRVAKAYAIAFGRGIGADLAMGDGVNNQPQGLLTGVPLASPPMMIGLGVESAGSQGVGSITAEEILSVYFSLNRVYRQSPKCAWVMSDGIYQRIRNSVDNIGRPLLRIDEGTESILGKKVLVDPNFPGGMPNTSPAVAGQIVFGDLSYFRVRVSQVSISKVAEFSGGIEKGIFQLVGRQRANSAVVDPTNGSGVNSPIVSALVQGA
jgi:HK97 family phage major capsid protein